ncbi:unnamed protein product [Effrenium voratum]|nr:unnamed protein product [Effrenium voratum]
MRRGHLCTGHHRFHPARRLREPFYPVSNITESPEWDECSWQELSKEAASFVTEALRKDPKDRITVGAAISHPWQNLFDDDAAPPKPTSTMFRDLSFLPASRAAKAKKAGYMPSASPHSEGHVFSSFGSSQSDWLS